MNPIYWILAGVGLTIILLLALIGIAIILALRLRWYAQKFDLTTQAMVQLATTTSTSQGELGRAILSVAEELKLTRAQLKDTNGRVQWISMNQIHEVLAAERARSAGEPPSAANP